MAYSAPMAEAGAAPPVADGEGGVSLSLTTKKEAVERIREGYDSSYYEGVYYQWKYAFGDRIDRDAGSVIYPSGDGILDFPDIRVRRQTIGESRRIVKAQFVGLSRTMSSTPLPHFKDVDKFIGMVRQQFWSKRYSGAGPAGGWDHEFQSAFMDGDGVGIGFLHWGVEDNPITGMQRTTCKHIPTIRVLRDRHERNPNRDRWIAFIRYMSPELAMARYPKAIVEDAIRDMVHPTAGSVNPPLRVVRVVHYYDLGYTPGRTPTYMCFVGNVSEDNCVKRLPSPSGDTLPRSCYVHYFAPGMDQPTGRIALQMPSQEAIDQVMRRLLIDINEGAGLRIFDGKQLDPEEIKKVRQGLLSMMVKKNADPLGNKAVEGVPPNEVHAATLATLQLLLNENTEQSGVDELMRGGQGQPGSTATQHVIQERKSAGDESWTKYQVAQFIMRSVECFSQIAKRHDRDPQIVDFLGSPIMVNDPGDLDSWCDKLFEQPSSVYVDEAKITIQSAREERRERLLELAQVAPYLATGMIDTVKFIEEVIRAALAEDPRDGWMSPVMTGAMSGGEGAIALGQSTGGMPGNGQPLPSGGSNKENK